MIKISERDKLLLIIVGFLLFVFVSYRFVYSPIKAGNSTLHEKLNQNNIRVAEAEAKKISVNKFNSTERQQYEKLEADLDKYFPTNLQQEELIYIVKQLTLDLPVKISTIDFAQKKDDNQTVSPVAALFSELGDAKMVKLSLQAKYSVLKKMMENIKASKPKVAISDLSMTSAGKPGEQDPDLKVNMTLNIMSAKLDGYRLKPEDGSMKYKPHGELNKPNIFTAIAGLGITPFILQDNEQANQVRETGTGIVEPQNDFYVIVSPSTFDAPSVILGESGSSTKAVYENKNGTVKASFEFTKKGGEYYYKCSTGTMKFPVGSGTEKFTPKFGQNIIIRASGNQIANTTDKVGVDISVNNKTDLPVQVVVENDNPTDNRINIIKKSANISEVRK